ncbi:O-antigen polymerase [Arhodomonas sp. SL1]|uniref:O-antigen polymerase n=1 Tax=Arhodomonas sp. SL1 TaxID=3425691 RepID=UPI003F884749
MVLLVIMAVVTLPYSLMSAEGSRMVLYGAFSAYLMALALPFTLARPRPSFFHPLMFYVLWVGVMGLLKGGVVLPAVGLDYHVALRATGSELNAVVATSFLLEAMAIVSLVIGYAICPRISVPVLSERRARAPALKSAMWVGLAGCGVLTLATIGGGLDQVLMQRGLPSDERIGAQIGSHWNLLASIGVMAPLAWIACDGRAVRRPVFWVLVLAALAFKFAATGSRGGTIGPLIMIGAVWMLHYQKVPYKAIAVGAVVSLITIGGLGEFRTATMRADALDAVALEFGIAEAVEASVSEMQRLAGANNGQLAVLGAVPERVPYLYGESYLSIPFVIIPSALWGEKPPAVGRMNSTQIFGNPLNTIPAGPVGEAYWNFSYPGVFILFLVYGVIMKVAVLLYKANPRNPVVIIGFICLIFYFQPNSDHVYSFVHGFFPAVLILMTYFIGSAKRHRVLPRRDWHMQGV